MTDRMKAAAQGVLDSALIVMMSRFLTLIGVPLLLASMIGTAATLSDLSRRMAVQEAQRATGREAINARLDRLETSDIRDRETMGNMASNLASVMATNQAILREVETMRREAILREQRGR